MSQNRPARSRRARSRPTAALTGLALLVAAPHAIPAHAAVPVLQKGLYKGTVIDPDGDPDSYAIAIRVTAKQLKNGRLAGRVSYRAAEDEATGEAPLNCRGTLTFRSSSGSTFRFRETIDGDQAAECVSGGTVTLKRTGGRKLSYRWSMAGIDRPAPTGSLAR